MPSPVGRYFDQSRHSDTARNRADVLRREVLDLNHAMVVLARWIGEADAAWPALTPVRRAAA